MSSSVAVRRLAEPWRITVCLGVFGFLALGVATHSFRAYHLFMLFAIPGAIVAAERGRRFFLDWAPLVATWLVYDRFRLIHSWLLSRVSVEAPYRVEQWLFGWLSGGVTPPHAARAWLAANAASPVWQAVALAAQGVYFAHIFVYPALFLAWWLRGMSRPRDRERFTRHVRAFTVVNLLGFALYLLIPAAPPWWVSLHGFATPTVDLVASANLAAAMDGALIRNTITTAPNWFAAVPSLHGAYPVLLFLLAWRERARMRWLVAIGAWGAAMWYATVALNQHYVVDLLAGAVVAAAAVWISDRLEGWGILGRGGESCEGRDSHRS
jgi:hypothetical protein